MLSFINALFGCVHKRCTFPITQTGHFHRSSEAASRAFTYIVCLDCGKEFRYDWQQMKVVGAAKRIHHAIA